MKGINVNGGVYKRGHELPMEPRDHIVQLYIDGHTYREIAVGARVSKSTSFRIVRDFITTGRLGSKPQNAARSRPPLLQDCELLYL